jgi:hypothetical protein
MKLIYLTKLNTHITMNRVIEFRVWDKDHKVMYNWSEIAIEKDQVFCSDGDIYISYDHCILMQFSGLLDKNGKKIFEGDIVKGHTRNFAVFYQAPFFTTRVGCDLLCGKYEVIGNVYENPDLCN